MINDWNLRAYVMVEACDSVNVTLNLICIESLETVRRKEGREEANMQVL